MMMYPEIGKYTCFAKKRYKVEETPKRLPQTYACIYLCDYKYNRRKVGDNIDCSRMHCWKHKRVDGKSVYLRYVGEVKDKRKGAHHAKDRA